MIHWIPRKYQLTALSFLLSNLKSGLFLDPGLGKTSIVLAAIKILLNAGQIKGVLLIAPLRVVYSVWPNEIEKWDNFARLTHTIIHDKTKHSLWGKQKDIYLINPEGLPYLYKELADKLAKGKKCPFDMLVIDESTRFKSFKTKTKKKGGNLTRFGYLKDMLPLFKRRHIMTGTPACSSLLDLWSQCFIIDEGDTLGKNYYKFRKTHYNNSSWNEYEWSIKDNSEEKIHKLVAPIVLEMQSEGNIKLPPITYNYINVDLPAKAMTHYKQMEKLFFIELDDMEASAKAAAQASMKCHQIANGKVYEDIPEDLTDIEIRRFKKTRKVIPVHSAKAEALENLINELNGKPLLIGYHYKHDLEAILSVCGAETAHIGSGVTPKESKRIERLWNAGKIPILIGHPNSMGHGLNLQGSGNDICWYSLPYSLELYIQFNKRIHRSGVTGNVRIHHLVAIGTLDEAILARLGERAKMQVDLRVALREYRRKYLR